MAQYEDFSDEEQDKYELVFSMTKEPAIFLYKDILWRGKREKLIGDYVKSGSNLDFALWLISEGCLILAGPNL